MNNVEIGNIKNLRYSALIYYRDEEGYNLQVEEGFSHKGQAISYIKKIKNALDQDENAIFISAHVKTIYEEKVTIF